MRLAGSLVSLLSKIVTTTPLMLIVLVAEGAEGVIVTPVGVGGGGGIIGGVVIGVDDDGSIGLSVLIERFTDSVREVSKSASVALEGLDFRGGGVRKAKLVLTGLLEEGSSSSFDPVVEVKGSGGTSISSSESSPGAVVVVVGGSSPSSPLGGMDM